MTQTSKRVWKTVAITLGVVVVLSLCVYGFFYGIGKLFFLARMKRR